MSYALSQEIGKTNNLKVVMSKKIKGSKYIGSTKVTYD